MGRDSRLDRASDGPRGGVARDGRVLVVGGTSGQFELVAKAEQYDPVSGRWTKAGTVKQPTGNHTLTLLPDGKALMVGGALDLDGQLVVASVESYDPDSGSWTVARPMSTARSAHTATVLRDGRVLIVGGIGTFVSPTESVALASVELYDPVTRRWTSAAGMAESRFGHTATMLADGKVLVVGGGGGFGVHTASAELYDPVGGSWKSTAAMIESHSDHTATLLADGKVLIAGGYDAEGAASAATELYDPTTGSWSAGRPIVEARIRHTATLLRDGTVLVAGNTYGEDPPATAELYGPGSGS